MAASDRDVTLQTWLTRGQRIFLILAILGYFLVRRQRNDSSERSGGVPTSLALLALCAVAAAAFVERYPALEPIPSAPIIAGFARSVARASGNEPNPLVERGRYLFAVSSCAFCHEGDGGGGNKASWSVFGSTWAANLTPDHSGLGPWSDEEILRALRSGVSRDGRVVHWQAMPWDLFSNYAEEDLRALIAFVRRMPHIERSVPKATAPGENDCARHTFWLRDGGDRPGCN